MQITMYGAEWCPDCRRTKDFLQKNNVDYNYINVDIDPEASKIVEGINNGKRIIPTLLIDGTSYSNPQNYKLAALLGINGQGKIVVYGADWCPDCRRAKRFLQDNQLNFVFVDVDSTPEAADFVTKINNGKRIIPTITLNEKAYTNPDNKTLTEILKLDAPADKRIYDVVIVGGGAAGLTTAIYAQRDKYDALILERKNIGGNAFITKKIENYPGFNEVSGPDLMDRMEQQAATLGAKIETGEDVTLIEKTEHHFKIHTTSKTFFGKTIVIATGSTYRTLGISGEEELIGAGIHFCATCDGAFYRDKEVIVIGGGNSALEEGMFLAGFCKKITLIHRSKEFSATETYIEKLKSFKNIDVVLNHTPTKFVAGTSGTFKAVQVVNNETEKPLEIAADGVFIFIGLIPNTSSFEGLLNLSDSGHILTKALNKTNVEGIFAAGDVRKGAIAQVAAATGEGVVASYGLRDYLTNL
ncbi:FAD-dependent oxidoreductase [Arenibacter sp. GZD96]|uniref:FAD-dependent oxidoreductase n=1 Tax=Aurantibrevibacter litoralis TaxID=3106030 RepID=UPI002B001FB3|nr:FAD-dependent oxidoreductase [Arenibacter sp. GZD-96]MEA1787426.1 FAD-dependent oxidoreductase [Arenibacter sp. GZD-96]